MLRKKLQKIIESIDSIESVAEFDDKQWDRGNPTIKRVNNSISSLEIQIKIKANEYAVGIDGKKKGNVFNYLDSNFVLNNENAQNVRYKVPVEEIESVIKFYAGVEKENMGKILFCRIASMEYYQDIEDDIQQDGTVHERFNFQVRDGIFKGFVQSSLETGGMKLARIDPEINQEAGSVSGVLVIFVADGCIVGYYKNAIVYSSIQDEENYQQGEYRAYNIETQTTPVLLSPGGRDYEIPEGEGAMGQSNVFYLYDDQGNEKQSRWIQDAVNYVRINKLVQSYIPRIVDYLKNSPVEIDQLINGNFDATSYPLLKTVESIVSHDENVDNINRTLNFRYWRTEYEINGTKYRFHSQWGGHAIWNENGTISLDEKHRRAFIDYLRNKGIYQQEEAQILINDTQENDTMEEIELLKYKKQIILQGSPGTGKTKLAKEIAEQMAPDNHKLIQFHPAYSYEDFVRGIVAATNDEGGISYEVKNKVLAEMAKNAISSPDENFVLIIDEINRANLSSVLGELIYALEYRDEAVESMYELKGDGREIILPKNLYIIGTMNTADRSVGYIDYAIRRRFAFVNVNTDEGVIPGESRPLFEQIKWLFDEHLSEEFELDDVMIGHSYFLKDDLAMALKYEIKPILQEYCKDGVLTCEKIYIENLDVD